MSDSKVYSTIVNNYSTSVNFEFTSRASVTFQVYPVLRSESSSTSCSCWAWVFLCLGILLSVVYTLVTLLEVFCVRSFSLVHLKGVLPCNVNCAQVVEALGPE